MICKGALLALALMAPMSMPATASDGRRLHLACARGAAPVCRTLLTNPKLAPGVRAAVEQQLAEIETALLTCEAGDCATCRAAAQRFPELPPAVLAAMSRCGQEPQHGR